MQLDNIESRDFTTHNFQLEMGASLPECTVAYETYGTLNATGDNAILVVHGYTSNHHAAGRYAPGKAGLGLAPDMPGWWDTLIGPGKAADTDRFFVVSVNALGSAHGSTGPNSINPATGKPWGPDFPQVTLLDSVRAQKLLVDHLGVKHLHAVMGPSMGGFQSFQWGVAFPDFVSGIVPTVTAPTSRGAGQSEEGIAALMQRLASDPNWNHGWYYENGGIASILEQLRFETLVGYGQREALAATIPDPAERDTAIRNAAKAWAKTYDGHSMVVLRRAINRFDVSKQYDRLKAKVLYVIAPNDNLFPGATCLAFAKSMREAGIDLTYVELVTNKGHLASHIDAAQWAPALKAFLARL